MQLRTRAARLRPGGSRRRRGGGWRRSPPPSLPLPGASGSSGAVVPVLVPLVRGCDVGERRHERLLVRVDAVAELVVRRSVRVPVAEPEALDDQRLGETRDLGPLPFALPRAVLLEDRHLLTARARVEADRRPVELRQL